MARAGRELAVAHGPQDPAQGLLGDRHAGSSKDLGQIPQPPAHHPVHDPGSGPLFDDPSPERLALNVSFSLGRLPGALPSIRPAGPSAFKATTQLTHRLQPDPADLGRLRTRATRGNHQQRQQAAGLGRIRDPLARDAAGRGASKSDRSGTGAAIASSSGFQNQGQRISNRISTPPCVSLAQRGLV